MVKYTLPLGLLVCCTFASGDILLSQIGDETGNGVGSGVSLSQYFEPTNSVYDVAALDNFTVDAPTHIHTVEMVIGGWGVFESIEFIEGFQVNVYSSPQAAGLDLVGDVATNYLDLADVSVSPNWLGYGYLLSLPVSIDVETGDLWLSAITENNFQTNGMIGVNTSLIGDEEYAWQANPNAGFGLPENVEQLEVNLAYNIYITPLFTPCEYPFPQTCSADVNSDGEVNIQDLLLIIGSLDECGDDTYRPVGDIAPMPSGDCCVNVIDILALINNWGEDCTVYGGCCFSDGLCTQTSQSDCATGGGEYFGDYSSCDIEECYTIACCVSFLDCQNITPSACSELGASISGGDCASADCSQVLEGDDCLFSLTAVEGANYFDTTEMTASHPIPDATQCAGTYFNWNETQQDIWFTFTPSSTAYFNFTLCDIASYDTSIVLYESTCTNQIACNGDYEPEQSNCQTDYSAINFNLIKNTEYFIRIGGFNDSFGEGTLTISANDFGACCLGGSCLFDLYRTDCEGFDGTFMGEGTTCVDSPEVCLQLDSDECLNPDIAHTGINFFDTTNSTPSTPEPNDEQCASTFLGWNESPDVWLIWHAEVDGIASFSTCSLGGFDTSLILYENNCITQVACNGNATPDAGCQAFYSSIEYAVTGGNEYRIRIGGYDDPDNSDEAETGAGILTISFVEDIGACCVADYVNQEVSCTYLSSSNCEVLGGIFTHGVSCAEFECEIPDCLYATFSQNVDLPNDPWEAGNATLDILEPIDYERAEWIDSALMNKLSIWGVKALYAIGETDPVDWSPCGEELDFTIRIYKNDPKTNLPTGTPQKFFFTFDSQYVTASTTDHIYAGEYESIKWEFEFPSTIELLDRHVSVQAETDDPKVQCWFMWLSSGTGDGISSVFENGEWALSDIDTSVPDLSICIE